ncbi:MAG: hypothetical protein ACOYMS_12305 [Terrimicrobiaceae bacterium]
MNYKAYIDYTCEEGIHAGVYKDDSFTYLRDAEPAVSHAIRGYLEVRLNEDIPRSWDALATLLRDGYGRMAPLTENSFHHIDTPQGSVELLYRAGLPATAEEALAGLQRYLRQNTHDGQIYGLPQSA